MIQRITSVDAVRKIDQVLLSNKNTLYSSVDKEVDVIEPIEKIDTSFEGINLGLKKEKLEEQTEEANRALKHVNAQLTFKLHEGTGRTLIQLIESDTREVIREIPPEKMLDMIAGIWKWSGITVDRME